MATSSRPLLRLCARAARRSAPTSMRSSGSTSRRMPTPTSGVRSSRRWAGPRWCSASTSRKPFAPVSQRALSPPSSWRSSWATWASRPSLPRTRVSVVFPAARRSRWLSLGACGTTPTSWLWTSRPTTWTATRSAPSPVPSASTVAVWCSSRTIASLPTTSARSAGSSILAGCTARARCPWTKRLTPTRKSPTLSWTHSETRSRSKKKRF
mmetsp:Transcript_84261/g.123257  ORF Transcript_84261/g.123257 Transcript_84261/m.123257 type:complete len:210 (+) Transcript_84261:2572-3201(+)